MPNESNGDWRERMDRVDTAIEHLLELAAKHDGQIAAHNRGFELVHEEQDAFRADLRDLLKYQVLFVDETRKGFQQLTAAQKRADEKLVEAADKLNALIDIVDGMVRRQPPAQG